MVMTFLKEKYAPQDRVSRIEYKRQITAVKMSEKENPSSMFEEFHRLSNLYSDANQGAVASNEDFMAQVFIAAPAHYQSVLNSESRAKGDQLTLDDMDLETHLLCMCPIKWRIQYKLTINITPVSTRALLLVLENIENNAESDYKSPNPNKSKRAEGKRTMKSINSWFPKKPKKVGWTDKHCILCKKHGGPFKSHNMRDCHRFNKDGTPIKNHGGTSRPQSNKNGLEGANFVQLMRTEIKKALCKHSRKDKKRRDRDTDSDSDSGNST